MVLSPTPVLFFILFNLFWISWYLLLKGQRRILGDIIIILKRRKANQIWPPELRKYFLDCLLLLNSTFKYFGFYFREMKLIFTLYFSRSFFFNSAHKLFAKKNGKKGNYTVFALQNNQKYWKEFILLTCLKVLNSWIEASILLWNFLL